MKKYKAVMTFMADPENPHEPCNDTAMDLVNIEDETDMIMCAEDEFFEGEIVSEDEIVTQNANYVYDDGVATGLFDIK